MKRKKIGVVLFQLGGPDSPAAVEPFLYNLFSDPDIIDFPFARIARQPLARLISSARSKKVREHYALIGGASPIGEYTRRQAIALEAELRKAVDARVFIAMRYWHPLIEETVRELKQESFDELVLLPLYPQYSKTTTGSSLNEWNRRYRSDGVRLRVIPQFFDYEPYIDTVADLVGHSLSKFEDQNGVHLVFSAHGVPVSVIEGGDPYQAQIESTVNLVLKRGGWSLPHTLCYQSKVGASRWLRPSLGETLDTLGKKGTKKVLAIPIAFVSDHVETLCEIDIEARHQAQRVGIEQFEMMPGLNDTPKFIQALSSLVLNSMGLTVPI